MKSPCSVCGASCDTPKTGQVKERVVKRVGRALELEFSSPICTVCFRPFLARYHKTRTHNDISSVGKLSDLSICSALREAARKSDFSEEDGKLLDSAHGIKAALGCRISDKMNSLAGLTHRYNKISEELKNLRNAYAAWLLSQYSERRKQANYAISNRELRLIVMARDKWRCLDCSAVENLTVDHIVPVILGGTDELENLQTLCRKCNSKKGKKVSSRGAAGLLSQE